MLPLVLIMALSSVASPRALPNADLVVHSPRLDKLDGLNAFLSRAGERSALLRPSSYSADFHPLLDVDPFRKASLEAAGIDVTSAATVSRLGDTRVTCTTLKDVALFERRAKERLAILGTVSALRHGAVSGQIAKSGLTAPAGYLLSGKESCAITGTSLTPESFQKFAAWMVAPAKAPTPSASGLTGVLYLYSHATVLGLQGTARSMTVEGKSRSKQLALSLTASGRTQSAGATPNGLAWIRLHAEPSALLRTSRQGVHEACRSCTGPAWDAFFEALGPLLTGESLTRVDHVKVEATLATAEGRFAALKQATLLELKSPEAARQALAALAKGTGLQTSSDGEVRVPLATALARVGVHGRWLYVTNDDAALAATADVFTAKAQLPAHPLEATLEPKLAARALRQIPLLDVLASPELAGLFAASAELGALLSASEKVHFWAQPQEEGSRFELVWTLPAP